MHATTTTVTDLFTKFDPNLIHLAAAALVVGLVMASARSFLGRLNGVVLIAGLAGIVHTQNWPLLYGVMVYGAVSSVLLLGDTRRARA